MLGACGGGETNPSAPGTSSGLAMVEPFVNAGDMSDIREAFSTRADSPWGFPHDGIDFFPAGDLKPFQAVASGKIEDIDLRANDRSGNWQVNVLIRYDSKYAVEYMFEPFTASAADGQAQRDQIVVRKGQTVAARELIGRLVVRAEAAHVHFGLSDREGKKTAICPEPFFTPEAREAVLALLHRRHPTWPMCS
jgi:hypothetical protein